MLQNPRLLALCCGMAAAIWCLTALPARAADPNGNWKWTFTTPNNGNIEMQLSLKAEGEKLTGKITRNNNSTDISDGKFKGDEVSFTVVRERDGQTFTTKYAGKVEGDSIKGKIEFKAGGETRDFDWNATREK